jgi:hypothetical protein
MTTAQPEKREEIILVDFEMSGVRGVARFSTEDLVERSKAAVETAMFTMRLMAARAVETIKKIKVSERPDKVEMEFGLKLDAEAGALVAKAGAEAAIKVTMTWENKKE